MDSSLMDNYARCDFLPESHPVQLVIFDCDGVLIDSEIISAQVLSEELAVLGIEADCDYILKHFLGISYTSMAEKLRQNLNARLPVDFKSHYRNQILQAFETRLQMTPGLEKVLDDLNVASCVATSSSPTRTARALELVGLTGFFGANVYTASEVENGKPAPDLFLHAAAKMNADPGNCLVIEDSPAGLAAARAAGMHVWRYTGASHLALANHGLPTGLESIPIIDNWQMFHAMAPGLTKSGVVYGD